MIGWACRPNDRNRKLIQIIDVEIYWKTYMWKIKTKMEIFEYAELTYLFVLLLSLDPPCSLSHFSLAHTIQDHRDHFGAHLQIHLRRNI
jgi:hypothetical protein